MSDQGQTPPPADETPWWAQGQGGATPSWWQDPPRRAPGPGGPPGQMPFAANADPAYARTYWQGPKTMAQGAVASLVWGLVSLFCCGIVTGPIAIVKGSQARFRVRTSNGRLTGDGVALLGMFLGGLSVFLFFFWMWWYATGHTLVIVQRNGTTTGN